MQQSTISDFQALGFIKSLNRTQQRIIKLLATGEMTQSQIADRLNVSRQYVNRLTRSLQKLGLIKKSTKTPTNYNCWYELNPLLENHITAFLPDTNYSACRVHNIRLKYRINKTLVSIDERTGYIKSIPLKGGDRHHYHIRSRAGLPDITIEVHPGTLVAYPHAGQSVIAESDKEQEAIINTTIHEAVLSFIEKQRSFGSSITIDQPKPTGAQITPTHYGFPFTEGLLPLDTQTALAGFYIDASPAKTGHHDLRELETHDPAKATALDRAILQILNPDRRDNPGIDYQISILQPILAKLEQLENSLADRERTEAQLQDLTKCVSSIIEKQSEISAHFNNSPQSKEVLT